MYAFYRLVGLGKCVLEIAAEQVPRTLPDVSFAVANGNYALEAGIIDKLIVTEDKASEGAQTYANIIACRAGEESSEKITALVGALQTDAVKTYIESTYNEAVLPIF